jgi:hypothetical protein
MSLEGNQTEYFGEERKVNERNISAFFPLKPVSVSYNYIRNN